ncbi:diguanylate cyclase (GGDEF domain) [Candidatus Magnetobacterium bavaricum]|uniref:diguanylate cyclase n=1 Tax=Candidatus Magnetobacterium bavaricum TaxID=29290 RepID=A0A0F3GPJ4_9BACT|nr:diguanylate cyclase (GGDEF domain) [Candidatus Magnetobacterium bavaricum]
MRSVLVALLLWLCFVSGAGRLAGRLDADTGQRAIVFTQPASSPPFAYVDRDGLPRGLVIDYWNLWAQRNNVKIEFVLAQLHESLQMVSQGRADVIGGIMRSEQNDKSLEFSEGFIDIKVCLYVPAAEEIAAVQDLKALTVAIVRDHAAIDYVKKKYPLFKIITFNGNDEMFKAVFGNNSYGFVSDFYTAKHYMTTTDTLSKYRVAKTLFTGSLMAGVRGGNTTMLTTLNDGMHKLDRRDIEGIYNKWIGDNPTIPDWFTRLLMGAGFAVLILGLVVYIFMLRLRLRAKTKGLKDAIEHIRDKDEVLELMVRSDRLTGLSNRLDIYDKLEYQQALFKRYHRCFCIVLCSIDEIKGGVGCSKECRVNMLVEAANRLRSSVRKQDIVGRWSMDEFILLLPETDLEGGSNLAEKLRNVIAARKFLYKDNQLVVTMTFGVSVYNADMPIDDCIRQADECLYIARKSGSNTVVGFKP